MDCPTKVDESLKIFDNAEKMNHSKTDGSHMGSAPEAVKFSAFLGPILLLTNIFFLNFISRIIFAPLLPSIQKDLGLAHVEAASFFLFVSMGYSV